MLTNLNVKHNLIFHENYIIAAYKLEPIDLIILPEPDQKIFINDMHHFLASIQENEIQIIMRTRKAIPEDFRNHFASIRNQHTDESQIIQQSLVYHKLIDSYVAQLSDLLKHNIIPVKEYYLIFKQHLRGNSIEQTYKAVSDLEQRISRIANNIARAGIGINQIVAKELEELLISFTRQ